VAAERTTSGLVNLMTKYQARPIAVQTRNTYGSALKEPTRGGKMSFGIAVGIQLT
jgi:hypothetical protein